MKIRPIGERVLVKLEKAEEKTVAGIILPTIMTENNGNIAKVEAIGSGDKIAGIINIGDRVVYAKDSGMEIEEGEEKYLILDIEDVLAIVE